MTDCSSDKARRSSASFSNLRRRRTRREDSSSRRRKLVNSRKEGKEGRTDGRSTPFGVGRFLLPADIERTSGLASALEGAGPAGTISNAYFTRFFRVTGTQQLH